MAKNPIFPLYFNDFDRSTRDWTDEEVGCYVRLLLQQWDKFGLPLGFDRLSRISPSVEKNWSVVGPKFKQVGSVLVNQRLEEIREERQGFLKKQAENGSKGGRPKTQKEPNENPKTKPKESLHNEDEYEHEDEIEKEEEVKTDWNKLAPRMLNIHIGKNPGYMTDKKKDFTNLLKIAYFIFEQSGESGSMFEHTEEILQAWGAISEYISKDKFYAQKGLNTISNNIQELANKAIHGDKSAENKKRSGTGKLSEEQLKKKLNARFGN